MDTGRKILFVTTVLFVVAVIVSIIIAVTTGAEVSCDDPTYITVLTKVGGVLVPNQVPVCS